MFKTGETGQIVRLRLSGQRVGSVMALDDSIPLCRLGWFQFLVVFWIYGIDLVGLQNIGVLKTGVIGQKVRLRVCGQCFCSVIAVDHNTIPLCRFGWFSFLDVK